MTHLDYLLKIPPEDLSIVEIKWDEVIVTFSDGHTLIMTAPLELRGNRFRHEMIKKYGNEKVK